MAWGLTSAQQCALWKVLTPSLVKQHSSVIKICRGNCTFAHICSKIIYKICALADNRFQLNLVLSKDGMGKGYRTDSFNVLQTPISLATCLVLTDGIISSSTWTRFARHPLPTFWFLGTTKPVVSNRCVAAIILPIWNSALSVSYHSSNCITHTFPINKMHICIFCNCVICHQKSEFINSNWNQSK